MTKVFFLSLLMWVGSVSVQAQTCGLRDNGDGTMTDPSRGLQIRKCPDGSSWLGNDCSRDAQTYTWNEAVQKFGGGEWRLMRKDEADQLVRKSKGCKLFESWTSSSDDRSPDTGINSKAWNAAFDSGFVNDSYRSARIYVLLVRATGSVSASVVCKAEIDRAIELCPTCQVLQRVKNNELNYKTWSRPELISAIKRSKDELRKWQSSPNGTPDVISLEELDICQLNAAMNVSQSTVSSDSVQHSDQRQGRQNSDTQGAQSNQAQSQLRENQQLMQSSQQLAQQNQARADQQRQGKRKTNDPAAQAHECVAIDQAGSGNFGAFKNTCGYKVNFTTCNYKPRTIQGGFNWSADFDCEKNQFGLHTPDAGRSVAAHNRNTEMVYWFACKAPATPVDAAFVVGKGIEARCH